MLQSFSDVLLRLESLKFVVLDECAQFFVHLLLLLFVHLVAFEYVKTVNALQIIRLKIELLTRLMRLDSFMLMQSIFRVNY